MITVEEVITFGYFKKRYSELVSGYLLVNEINKDTLNKIVQYKLSVNPELDAKEIKSALIQSNYIIRQEAEQYAKDVIQIHIDALNRQNYTLDQVRNEYSKIEEYSAPRLKNLPGI